MMQKNWKWLKPWQMGTHLRVLSESYPINTNMTGFGWFSEIFCILVLLTKVAPGLEGLNIKWWHADLWILTKCLSANRFPDRCVYWWGLRPQIDMHYEMYPIFGCRSRTCSSNHWRVVRSSLTGMLPLEIEMRLYVKAWMKKRMGM